ncbi:MAG: 30S ribosomal protein S17 [Candidatus Magasanikbacteria bacterium]|nr:30S ribosomal protein S17 [Candidatus Magasanikbacteria bacterium]
MTEKAIIKKQRRFSGEVISAVGQKTIVVKVDRLRINRKYHKNFIVSRKFKVHDEKNQFKTGDKVVFVQCRPLSKDKKWRVAYQPDKD